MKFKILYDNNALEGFKLDWGFSCLVENREKVLFETGADSAPLLYNMEKLKINPEDIDIVVLSHSHWDHTGGLKGFLKSNNNKAKVLGKIHGIFGGFHGVSKFEKLEGIEFIVACHYTKHIKERYPHNYKEIKVGSVIEI